MPFDVSRGAGNSGFLKSYALKALDAELREAGIVANDTSADSVLARLKDRGKS
ncbi:hypothetical protein ACQKQA_19725 [Pseudomonas sp. NPDC089530]|uniref:hypothetical protein n=1 Tax=Pseudomonas sp. NPDC089530 TaxID=3390651 RepID=UPI003CFC99D7